MWSGKDHRSRLDSIAVTSRSGSLTAREFENNQRLLDASDHRILFADHSSLSLLLGVDEGVGSDVSKSDVFRQEGCDSIFYN